MNVAPKKLVCIFAHPDDEAFGPGGAIAHFAKTSEVHLICVTNGDAQEKFTDGNMSGKELGLVRRHELQNSASILGIKSVTFLDFIDGSLNNNNYHDVANKLKEILDEMKPDTIMTFDQNGVSGHLDHIAVAMECSFLFERLPFIKTIMYYGSSRETKEIVGKDYFVYFPEGYKESDVDFVMDTTPYLDVVDSAMQAHVSQHDDYLWIKEKFGKLLNKEYFKVLQK